MYTVMYTYAEQTDFVRKIKKEKGGSTMRNVKYTDSVTFRCLEHLRETSLDISLIHAGREHCKPSHI